LNAYIGIRFDRMLTSRDKRDNLQSPLICGKVR